MCISNIPSSLLTTLPSFLSFRYLGQLHFTIPSPLQWKHSTPGFGLGALGGMTTDLPSFLGLPFFPLSRLLDLLNSVVLLTMNTACSFLISTPALFSMANNSEGVLVIPCMF